MDSALPDGLPRQDVFSSGKGGSAERRHWQYAETKKVTAFESDHFFGGDDQI